MVVVEPRGTGMALFTLRAAEEVRAAQFGMAEGELDAEMVAIAKAIITQRTGSFDPTTYRDRYQEALQELIEAKMKGLTVKPREIAAPPPVIDLMTALKRSLAREASGSKHTAPKKAKMAPDRRQAGSLAARSRGSETESTDRRRAHHSRSKAAQTSNCLIRTPFLRHLSRRVVRVEIGQKPGVVRGTGSSNPSPSSGESVANSNLSAEHANVRAARSGAHLTGRRSVGTEALAHAGRSVANAGVGAQLVGDQQFRRDTLLFEQQSPS